MLTHGHHQIRYQQTIPDIPLDGLRLHIHPPDKLYLGDHAGGFLLPVEDVYQLVVQGIHRPVDEGVRAFSLVIKSLLGGFLPFGAQHQGAGLVLLQPEQPVHGVGHIVLAGVVHEIKHHQALLTGGQPHAAAQLLGIEHLGHGRSSHKQHLGGRAVPALVEQIAGAQHLDLALFKPGQYLPAVAGLDLSGHRLGYHTGIMKPPGDLLGVLDGGAEDHSPLVLYILEPGIHNELVALRHIDLALQIPDVVLDTVEPYLGQVDVGVDADAPHRNQLADLHGGLDIQLVGGVLEDVQDVLVVGPLRCGGQTKSKFRREVGQDLLICIGGGVVGLVHDDVAEVIRFEPLQIQCYALDAAADYKSVLLFAALNITSYSDLRPQFPEGLGGLIYQFHRVGQEQRPLSKPLGVHDGGHRLVGAGGVVEKGDGLKAAAHFLQSSQGLLLVLLQFQSGAVQRLAPLGGEVVFDFSETGVLPQEYPQLVSGCCCICRTAQRYTSQPR